jgi:archaellum component FlaC
MDQRENQGRVEIDETRSAVTEKLEMLEERVLETMEGTKSTIDGVMNNIKQVQVTVEDAKSAVDNVLETVKFAMDETLERVKYATDIMEQVDRNPWIMFGSAILMGYVLSSINYNGILNKSQTPDRRGEIDSFAPINR